MNTLIAEIEFCIGPIDTVYTLDEIHQETLPQTLENDQIAYTLWGIRQVSCGPVLRTFHVLCWVICRVISIFHVNEEWVIAAMWHYTTAITGIRTTVLYRQDLFSPVSTVVAHRFISFHTPSPETSLIIPTTTIPVYEAEQNRPSASTESLQPSPTIECFLDQIINGSVEAVDQLFSFLERPPSPDTKKSVQQAIERCKSCQISIGEPAIKGLVIYTAARLCRYQGKTPLVRYEQELAFLEQSIVYPHAKKGRALEIATDLTATRSDKERAITYYKMALQHYINAFVEQSTVAEKGDRDGDLKRLQCYIKKATVIDVSEIMKESIIDCKQKHKLETNQPLLQRQMRYTYVAGLLHTQLMEYSEAFACFQKVVVHVDSDALAADAFWQCGTLCEKHDVPATFHCSHYYALAIAKGSEACLLEEPLFFMQKTTNIVARQNAAQWNKKVLYICEEAANKNVATAQYITGMIYSKTTCFGIDQKMDISYQYLMLASQNSSQAYVQERAYTALAQFYQAFTTGELTPDASALLHREHDTLKRHLGNYFLGYLRQEATADREIVTGIFFDFCKKINIYPISALNYLSAIMCDQNCLEEDLFQAADCMYAVAQYYHAQLQTNGDNENDKKILGFCMRVFSECCYMHEERIPRISALMEKMQKLVQFS